MCTRSDGFEYPYSKHRSYFSAFRTYAVFYAKRCTRCDIMRTVHKLKKSNVARKTFFFNFLLERYNIWQIYVCRQSQTRSYFHQIRNYKHCNNRDLSCRLLDLNLKIKKKTTLNGHLISAPAAIFNFVMVISGFWRTAQGSQIPSNFSVFRNRMMPRGQKLFTTAQ